MESENEASYQSGFTYRVIEYLSVFNFLSTMLCCKKCHGDVTFHQTFGRGLGFKLVLKCKNCQPASVNSSPLINDDTYDINLRLVFAFRLLGICAKKISEFCATMDFSLFTFTPPTIEMESVISNAAEIEAKKSMRRAVKLEKEALKTFKEEGLTVFNLTTWQEDLNRDYLVTLYGFITLFAQRTRKIIDLCVSEIEPFHRTPDKAIIREETKAVVEMFLRSEKNYGVQYEKYDVDKDSKIFEEIKRIKPYKNVNVEKINLGGDQKESLLYNYQRILWTIAPKYEAMEGAVPYAAAYTAICVLNDGARSIMKIMETLGLTVGENCYNYYIGKDYD